MANTSSAKKAIRSQERKRVINLTWKKKVKRSGKDLENLLSGKKATKEDVSKALAKFKKTVDKSVKSGPIHANKGSRLKSKLDKEIHEWAKSKE